MAYEGGYTSAVDSAQRRQTEQTAIQRMLQDMAAQQWQMDQIKQQQDQANQSRARAGDVLSTMYKNPPPPPAGPQSPPPGQSSQPMMMPPPQPGANGGGMPPPQMGMGMGMPPPPMPAQPQAQPPAPPQGWKPSPGAPTALGGGAPQPASAPPAQPEGMPPPPVGGPAPGGAQGGVIPPQMLSVPNAIQTMQKMGVPSEKMVQVLEQMLPAINASNKEAFDSLKMQNAAQDAALHAYKASIDEFKARQQAGHQDALESEAIRRNDISERRADNSERRTDAMIARSLAQSSGGGGGGLHDDAVDLAAAQYLKSGSLPPMYRNQAGREKIMNRAAEMKREQGGDVSDVASDRAQFKADQGSLNFQQKRVDAIEGSMKKIGKDMTTMDSILDKSSFGGPKVVNTPVNQLRRQMSDPQLAQLDLAAQQVGLEYERMMQSGMMSVAQLHAGASEDAKKLINGDMSPKEIRAKVAIMRREMDNAKSSATDLLGEIKGRMKGSKATAASAPANANAKGWTLHTDKNGNKAYVSPDGKQFEEVQ
jgi:hypothetical protein